MEKERFLKHWASIRKNQKLNPRPVRYRHEGSTYEEDGIRITGSRTFIDSVLSRLKDLLAYENHETRLQVVYKKSADRASGKQLKSWNCYVQVHQRGSIDKPEEKNKARKKK
ncbi:MAG TPA: hypothetical protein VK654_17410 [Nitrospirota bacterium]|nr:hypothetical protein [Nitrospirota bacterium]